MKENMISFNVGIEGLTEESNNVIVVKHGPLTLKAVDKLSKFICDLPVERNSYDKLIELMKNMLLMAEREQYMQGFTDGVVSCKSGSIGVMADRLLVSDEEIFTFKDK